MKSVDKAAALKVPGVVQIVDLPAPTLPSVFQPLGGVAVLAANTWAAIKGREALTIAWDDGPNAAYDSDVYRAELAACEACKAFYPRVKQILAAFPRETRLVIRYTPFHREVSVEAVRLLEAARAQGKFEPMLEALLDGQRAWTGQGAKAIDRAWAIAQSSGLDVAQARQHIASGMVDTVPSQDVSDLKAIGVRATPTFFINGKPLSSTDPEQLYELVKS